MVTGIRENEEDQIPLEEYSGIGFVSIFVVDGKFKYSSYNTKNPTQLGYILADLEMAKKGEMIQLLAIWPGQWSTDAFPIRNLDLFISRVKSEINRRKKK
jgi:hypothetical protein